MKIYILYNQGTEGERAATSLHERLVSEQTEAELIDADSPRGIDLAGVHDILGRPAVLVVSNDGTPVQVWQGQDNLPALGELIYYARQ